MRRIFGAVAVGGVALLSALPAYAAGSGQIDHIETAANGTVKVLYSVPGLSDGTTPDLGSVRVEVAGKPVPATASSVEAGEIERTAVLALDVSNSMAGERFGAAKQAALTYLDAAPDDVAVGLVTFAGTVDVLQSPTTDHDALVADVESLELAHGTMLYDAVLEAVAQTGSEGQRQVVVLSDGADTGSTPLNNVVAAAESSGVLVNVVALEQSATNQAKLQQITSATGGAVLPADDPQALAAVFAAEAEALAQQVLVEFTPAQTTEASLTVSLDAGGETYSDSAFASFTAATEESGGSSAPIPVEAPEFVIDELWLFVGLGAVGLGLAVILAIILVGRPREKQSLAERQLAHYTHGPSVTQQSGHRAAAARPQVNVRESAVALANQVVKKGDLEARLTAKLTAAGIALTAAEWLLLHAGIAVLSALIGLMLSGGNPAVIVILLFFGSAGPWLYLSLKRSRRVKAFNSQLADTLQLMSGGLSAGLSLPQSVDTVVREGSEPMSGELRRALVEQRLGVDIEDALDGVGERMGSEDFGWIVMAIRIQREVGGNLAELLNTVAATLREREYLRRQVLTLSAEGRLSAWILGGLPPGFVGYLAVARPDYLQPLITTPMGWAMSAAAAVMLAVGGFWMAKTVKVEV